MNNVYNDDFFILQYRNGNKSQFIVLLNRYKIESRKLANYLYGLHQPIAIVSDDFYSIALEAFFTALEKYKFGVGSFHSYWKQIAVRECMKMLSYDKKFHRNNDISFDEPITSNEDTTYSEIIGLEDGHIIGDYEKHELDYQIHQDDAIGLTLDEKKVLTYYLKQIPFAKIGELMGQNENRVRYLFKRGIEKFRKYRK